MNQSEPIVVVTGNPNKLKEIMAIAGDFPLTSQSIDLDEIQTLDLHAIVTHKLKQAYEQVKRPVIVEDVSAELEAIGGLPGPFVKFFMEKMGRSALYDLSQSGHHQSDSQPSDKVVIRCLAGYFDGEKLIFGEGTVQGIVTQPRGENGFGFDASIIPEGETQTVAEMPTDKKNTISHRSRAMRALFEKL